MALRLVRLGRGAGGGDRGCEVPLSSHHIRTLHVNVADPLDDTLDHVALLW